MLGQVREGAARGSGLDLVTGTEQMPDDDPGPGGVPQTLAVDAVQDAHDGRAIIVHSPLMRKSGAIPSTRSGRV